MFATMSFHGIFGSSTDKTVNPYNFSMWTSDKGYFGALESVYNCYDIHSFNKKFDLKKNLR